MRLRDALKLGRTSVRAHKLRSVAVVLTISVMFSLVIGVNFILRGLENNLLSYARTMNDGKIYLASHFPGSKGEKITQERLEEYHGTEIGRLTKYEIDEYEFLPVISKEVVKSYLTKSLAQVPEGKLPIVVSRQYLEMMKDGITYGEYYELPSEQVEEVGVFPSTNGPLRMNNYCTDYEPVDAELRLKWSPTQSCALQEFSQDELKLNILDFLIFDQINSSYYGMYIVDDGSGRVERTIGSLRDEVAKKRKEMAIEMGTWQEGDDFWREDLETTVSIVASFDNVRDAYNYMERKDEHKYGYSRDWTDVREIFGNQTSIYGAVRSAERILSWLLVAILVVAVVVMAFTFAHLVALEAPTIALYRSLGAMTKDVVLIYLVYLIELCLLAVVVATVIGLGIAGVVTAIDGELLKTRMVQCYQTSLPGPVILIGAGWKYFEVVGLMLLVAPVAFLLTFDQLSPRRIAQRLKQD